jgi:hypothetical protein
MLQQNKKLNIIYTLGFKYFILFIFAVLANMSARQITPFGPFDSFAIGGITGIFIITVGNIFINTEHNR